MSTTLSFVRRGCRPSVDKPTPYPLQRVEPLLRKYFKVFQLNLDRMQQHKVNIQKVFELSFFHSFELSSRRFVFRCLCQFLCGLVALTLLPCPRCMLSTQDSNSFDFHARNIGFKIVFENILH